MAEDPHSSDELHNSVGEYVKSAVYGFFREKKCVFFVLLALLIVAGIPTVILVLVIPLLVKVAVVVYICTALAATWAAFAMVFILSKLQNKYRWIAYESPSAQS